MMLSEIIILLMFIACLWFWLDSIHTKEIAARAGKKNCINEGVDFLDDTVEITRIRLKRDAIGKLHFYREYQFEFSSDGSQRYRGKLTVFGKQVGGIVMEPHRVPADYNKLNIF